MNPTEIIHDVRERRKLSVEHCAALVGLTVGSFWDLESFEEDFWCLTIAEFLRLCLILRTGPHQLVPSDNNIKTGEHKLFTPDPFGKIHIGEEFRRACPDLFAIEDTVGWYGVGLTEWLQDDWHLGQMPLAALKDLCLYLNWDMPDILQTYWQAIGGPGNPGS